MSESSILQALESTCAVVRVLGEAICASNAKVDQALSLLLDMSERGHAHSDGIHQLQRALGTQSSLLEQYRSDLESHARSQREQMTIIRAHIEHISQYGCTALCPPPDTTPSSEEKTDPGVHSTIPQLAAVR